MKSNGSWDENDFQHHQISENLSKVFCFRFHEKDIVLDFGCGNGYYIDKLKGYNYEAYGFDGYKSSDQIIELDLTKPFDFGKKGNVISLEVGEHIPKEFQEIYLSTITSHCINYLFLSWAEIGQPGIGHVNCRDQQEVIEDIKSRGFEYLEDYTKDIRLLIEDNCDWFRRTLLIFRKI